MAKKREAELAEVAEMVDKIRSHLAGLDPGTQGAILCDLVATHLAGHPPEMRQVLFDLHIETVRELIPVNERILLKGRKNPWTRTQP